MSNQVNVVFQPSKTTHWKNLFPNKSMLLGSHNLNKGEELVLQIASVEIGDIKNHAGKNEKVPILRFQNAAPMVLNITNTRTIAAMYGENYDLWVGCFIQLYAATINVKGVSQSALRVRPKKPVVNVDLSQYENLLKNSKNLDELRKAFMSIPKEYKQQLTPLKDQIKESL